MYNILIEAGVYYILIGLGCMMFEVEAVHKN